MIIKELHRKRADGVKLYRTYSDQGLKIKQVETGAIPKNGQAIDVEGAPFTYVETEEKIEQLLTEGEEKGEM